MAASITGLASPLGAFAAPEIHHSKSIASAADGRDEARIRFDLDDIDLQAALQLVAIKTGHKLFYRAGIMHGYGKRSLKGEMTVAEAIGSLLAGTRLEFEITPLSVVVIRESRSRPEVGSSSNVRWAYIVAALSTLGIVKAAQPAEAQASVAGAVEEILVTARRREESLQDVPIAISALNSDALELRGIESADDLTSMAPNLRVQGGTLFGRSQGTFRMRGIPGVAVYVDGIVRSGVYGALQNVVELERVEVLRGPQGTLFGKNAMGGAIQYVSQRPADKFGARVKTTFGSSSRVDVTANVDLPLSETVLTKLTAAKLTRDGYMKSTTVDNALGSQDDTVVRGELLWQPSDAFNSTIVAEYAQQRSNGAPGTIWSLNPFCPGDPRPSNYNGPGAPNGACIYEAVGIDLDREWLHGSAEEWKTASNYMGRTDDILSQGVTLESNWSISDSLSTKLLAGYREIEFFYYHDFDSTPWNLFEGSQAGERDETSVEFQLIHAGDRLTGTSGIYYYSDDNAARVESWVSNDLRREPYLSARQALGGGYASFNPLLRDTLTYQDSEGWAVFTEWTFDLTEKLSITAGARYNEDTISQTVYRPLVPIPTLCCVPAASIATAAPIPNQGGEATFTEVSPRASIQYQWTDDIMTYVTYSKGFGAGGFTGGNIPGLPNGGFRAYEPETMENYELGLRADLFDRRLRLNATYFQGKYDGIQISQERIPPFPEIFNAGKADVEGIELEGEWRVARSFALNYGLAWLDTQFTDVGTAVNLTLNTPFAWAPERSYTLGAQYNWSLQSGAGVMLRGDYTWQDAVYTTTDTLTSSRQEAYGVLGGRLTYLGASGNWDVSLIGSNLANEYYRIGGFFIPTDQIETGTPARPREWGVTFSFRFE